jgi:hypothetical protein
MAGIYANNCRLYKLLNDQYVTKETREKIKKFLEFNENESITYQNLSETAKAVLREKFIAMSAYIKKTESSQLNNIMVYLIFLEKQEQAKPKTSRIEIKSTSKINKIETKKLYIESTKQNTGFLKR